MASQDNIQRRRLGSLTWLLLAGPLGAAAMAPLRIATDSNDHGGLAPAGRAVLTRAFARLGLPLKFESLPLRRSLRLSSQGELDGEALRVASLAEDNPQLLVVPVVIAEVELHLFARAALTRPLPDSIAALRPWRIAHQRGIVLLEQLLADMPRRLEVLTPADLLRTLRQDMADVGLLTLAAGQPLPAGAQEDGLVHAPEPLLRMPLHVLLHKRHHALVPRLTAELQAMEASGESARLRAAAWAALAH